MNYNVSPINSEMIQTQPSYTEGCIFDIKELTVHDGPGVRVTIFLKGCPLSCIWCHNPEGISPKPELMIRENGCRHCGMCLKPCNHPECQGLGRCIKICPLGLIQKSGYYISSRDLSEKILRLSDVLDSLHGGYTLSGGEPLFQPRFLFDLISFLKPHHVAIETSGFAETHIFKKAMDLADLILFDIKHMDPEAHKKGTGVDNNLIQSNLSLLISSGKPFIARIPIIPGYNDDPANMRATAQRLKEAKDNVRVELLPYNPFAGAKYPMLRRIYSGQEFDKKVPNLDPSFFDELGLETVIL
ncbi:MAG: 4-hydroxyphenylacetate decarboxylase activating enzyme [Spirochaetes bacterium ADurb.Bin110]|nr:MAG: 4-hydroxyphenylacetate decarboxylase activating enzyme [Spirochaetes bacterium ADurb.Bin110]